MTRKEVEQLFQVARSLRLSVDNHYAEIQKESCDKNGIGFNLDDRFSVAKISLSLDSWRGYYGNSGSSKSVSVHDDKVFARYLLKYLNKNIRSVLDGVHALVLVDVETNKGIIINELKEELAAWGAFGEEADND